MLFETLSIIQKVEKVITQLRSWFWHASVTSEVKETHTVVISASALELYCTDCRYACFC